VLGTNSLPSRDFCFKVSKMVLRKGGFFVGLFGFYLCFGFTSTFTEASIMKFDSLFSTANFQSFISTSCSLK